MFGIVFALIAMSQSLADPAEIKDALAHAEALYYSAHFSESVELLVRIDQTLASQAGRLDERVDTKVHLALSYIGMNDSAKAKSSFMELYALKPDYALDARAFAPKVIALADEARTEQEKVRCFAAQTQGRDDVDNGRTAAFLDLLGAMGSKCAVLAAMAPQAAEMSFRRGIAAYKAGDFPSALAGFEAALTLSPEHELARDYVDLTRSKLQVGQDRLLIDWQRHFNAREFSAASAEYHEMTSRAGNPDTKTVTYVTDEYRKALSSLVTIWNRVCLSGEAGTLKAISGQISDLLPEPSFGADIRSQMKPCEQRPKAENVPPPQPVAEIAAPAGIAAKVNAPGACLEMSSPLAMMRLKNRVDPVIKDDALAFLRTNGPTQVRVKARISESGDLTVIGMPEGKPILQKVVRDAVTQWKFAPIRDASGIRCVDTEINLLLKFQQ